MGYKNNMAASAETHTHTAPPRPVTKAPQQALGARWACPGHDTDSRVTDAAARILCAEVPRLVDSVGRNNGGD
jgi:hypothetical protein